MRLSLLSSTFALMLFVKHFATVASQTSTTLVLAQILFRHGDRSSLYTYKNDPYNESSWQSGFGQLTRNGISQEYQLGQWLRMRYGNFLSNIYYPREVVMKSSDYDRTLMSASAVLAGLYPPFDQQLWSTDIRWQPIPIHSEPEKSDRLFHIHDCPHFDLLSQRLTESSEEKNLLKKYKVFLDSLSLKAGEDMHDLRKVFHLHDTLLCEKANAKPQPSWVTEDLMNTLSLSILPEFARIVHSTTEQIKISTGGLLLSNFIANMQMKSEDSLPQKMLLFSGHDSNIMALLFALRSYNDRLVPYSAALIVELHFSRERGHFVEIYFRNGTHSQPHRLVHPDCLGNCTLSQFVEAAGNHSMNFEKDCFSAFSTAQLKQVMYVGLYAMLGGALFFIFLLWLNTSCGVCRRKRKTIKARPLRLPNHPEEMPMMGSQHPEELLMMGSGMGSDED